jgi:diguanylate cyclase (GGDEF)-like protein
MTNPRILIADDSMVVRAVIKNQLASEKYDLVEAASGDEALARCRADAPDVVLLDVEMPGMNGYEVLQAMKADPKLVDVPVVFLSGRVSADDVARGLELGAHDYLRKPAEAGELIARVTAALRTKALHDQLRRDNAHLRELAPLDSLTGALDIRGLQHRLKELADETRSSGHPLGAVLLDVDALAAINERFGWDGGDDVLRVIASRITARLTPDQSLGRCGPDELLVLLPGVDDDGAHAFASQLRSAVSAAPHVLAGEPVIVEVSVGAAATRDGQAEQLLVALQEAIVADKARRGDGASASPGAGSTLTLNDESLPSFDAGLPPLHAVPALEPDAVADPESTDAPAGEPVSLHVVAADGDADAAADGDADIDHNDEVDVELWRPIDLPDHLQSRQPARSEPEPEPETSVSALGQLVPAVEPLLVDDPGAIRDLVSDLRPKDDRPAHRKRRFFSSK